MNGEDEKIEQKLGFRDNSFMGAGIAFRLSIALACLAVLWLGVLWAMA